MKVVRAVIGGQGMVFSSNRKFSLCNAVAIPANDGAKIGMLLQVPAEGVKPENDIACSPFFIWHEDMGDNASIIGDLDLHPISVAKCEKINCPPIGQGSKRFPFNCNFWQCVVLHIRCRLMLFRIVGTAQEDKEIN